MNLSRRKVIKALPAALLAAIALIHGTASAFTVNITAGTRVVYLAVGNGSFTGTLQGGGTPANNTTVNTVSVTVAANLIGNAVAQPMQTSRPNASTTVDMLAGAVTQTSRRQAGSRRRPQPQNH